MERHNDEETEMSYGETEMRDKDKIIFFFFIILLQYNLPLELHCSSIAKKFAILGFKMLEMPNFV